MGPTTRNGLRSKRLRTEANGQSISSAKIDDSDAVNGAALETFAKNSDCLLLAPEEYEAGRCLNVRVRCPLTGTSACYVVDREQELVWRIVQYRHEEFASVLTPTEILPPSDPFFILTPVNPFALILPYLLNQESASSSAVENGTPSTLELFGRWETVLSILRVVGEFAGTETELSTYRLDRSKLGTWIAQKTRDVYERLKTGGQAALDDRFCREFAMKVVRQQLPLELRDLASL